MRPYDSALEHLDKVAGWVAPSAASGSSDRREDHGPHRGRWHLEAMIQELIEDQLKLRAGANHG
jgi:hypothetical protein